MLSLLLCLFLCICCSSTENRVRHFPIYPVPEVRNPPVPSILSPLQIEDVRKFLVAMLKPNLATFTSGASTDVSNENMLAIPFDSQGTSTVPLKIKIIS